MELITTAGVQRTHFVNGKPQDYVAPLPAASPSDRIDNSDGSEGSDPNTSGDTSDSDAPADVVGDQEN
jgi:hypothetical protein